MLRRAGWRGRGAWRGAGAAVPVRTEVFARDCYIELSFDSRQLKAVRHYIRLNPARRLWKLCHPDLFVCHRAIKAARLAALAPRQFDGLGNLTLLGSPFLFHVRLTLKKTVAAHGTAAISSLAMKRDPSAAHAFRRNCLEMNDIAKAICEAAM